MLKQMRRRVILAAMLAFFAVVLMIAALVNIVNYCVVTGRADETLSAILSFEEGSPFYEGNSGAGPVGPVGETEESIDDNPVGSGKEEFAGEIAQKASGLDRETEGAAMPEARPPERPFNGLPDVEANYMTRFFVVRMDADGKPVSSSIDYIASVDEALAFEYASLVLEKKRERGYLKEYRYVRGTIRETSVVVFLNASRELQSMRTLLLLTVAVSCVSLLIVFGLVEIFAGRAIRPIANNISQQKQFITDASHELKTPLTSIVTSLDVLEMDKGQDEWTENIRHQTSRMSKLVSELVTLSRLDEDQPMPDKEHFALDTAAWEIFDVYQPQAKAAQKEMSADIEEGVTLLGDKASIQQMLSVLLDNAIRYSDEKGEIRLSVFKKAGRVRIEVFNTCNYEVAPDTERLFDRFYRPDSSRSTVTGGNGVGLSIARAVVQAHGGTITASCPSGKTMTMKIKF
ncbi:MAG: HAMP domain-containing histidine kinase [Lachnospiraceae bacterium]|nr:HAMP domain-containing histidine kinase [Lachnospiraceae bacterium]